MLILGVGVLWGSADRNELQVFCGGASSERGFCAAPE